MEIPLMREEMSLLSIEGDKEAALVTALCEELERVRGELEAYNPVQTLNRGESAALCATCESSRAVPGLPGCAKCVREMVDRVRRGSR